MTAQQITLLAEIANRIGKALSEPKDKYVIDHKTLKELSELLDDALKHGAVINDKVGVI